MGGYALARPGEAHALLGGGFHADKFVADPAGGGNIAAHSVYIRAHFRPLSDNGAIDIHYRETFIRKHLNDLGEQLEAVRTLVFCVIVGEKAADIAERGGAEQGVAHGMEQHIRVGVTEQTFFIRNLNAAYYQLPALDEAVNVVAVTYSQHISPL